MSWSVIVGGTGVVLGAFAGVLAGFGWYLSLQEGKAKEDALEKYKSDATERVKTLERETAMANQRAAEAELKTLELRRALLDRRITVRQRQAFIEASKTAVKPPLIKVVAEDELDSEASGYANSVFITLQKAGYNVVRLRFNEWPEVPKLPSG